MALITDDSAIWIDIPHEPGQRVRIRRMRVGDLEGSATAADMTKLSIDAMAACTLEWTYDLPPTRENIAHLDIDTFGWLAGAIQGLSGLRSEAEKKGSNGSSSPTSDLVAAGSLLSSGI